MDHTLFLGAQKTTLQSTSLLGIILHLSLCNFRFSKRIKRLCPYTPRSVCSPVTMIAFWFVCFFVCLFVCLSVCLCPSSLFSDLLCVCVRVCVCYIMFPVFLHFLNSTWKCQPDYTPWALQSLRRRAAHFLKDKVNWRRISFWSVCEMLP